MAIALRTTRHCAKNEKNNRNYTKNVKKYKNKNLITRILYYIPKLSSIELENRKKYNKTKNS